MVIFNDRFLTAAFAARLSFMGLDSKRTLLKCEFSNSALSLESVRTVTCAGKNSTAVCRKRDSLSPY